jgi:hypothetical protein
MRYYLLDGARCDEALEETLKRAPKYQSLYKGRSEENLASVAPYLLEANQGFEQYILENGWGNSWGYFLICELPFEALYNHFRKLLIVEDEDFKPLYFRFYDPRVIRLFLPTCDMKQLLMIFGPVEQFICEKSDDISKVLIYKTENGILKIMEEGISQHFAMVSTGTAQLSTSTTSNTDSNHPPYAQIEIQAEPSSENTQSKRRFIY